MVVWASGCAAKYSMFKEYAACEKTYFDGSELAAKASLVAFLDGVTKNKGAVPDNPESVPAKERLNYPNVLGLSWWRLARIYRLEHDDKNYSTAMTEAINYFDNVKIPDFSADSKYKKNKEACLLEYLEQVEAASPPKWRNNFDPQKQNNH